MIKKEYTIGYLIFISFFPCQSLHKIPFMKLVSEVKGKLLVVMKTGEKKEKEYQATGKYKRASCHQAC